MKSLLILILVFISSTALFSQSNPDWKWIHPRPQGQYLQWMTMIDANTWYAAGDYGMFMKTTNAGVNWSTKTGGYQMGSYPGMGIYQNFRGGYFLNANTGFLGVQAVPGIVKTTNGGLTLDTIRILSSGSGTVYGFSFLNASTGYLAGTGTYKVMKTTDGGLTWNVLPNLGALTYYSVYASDENNIIASSESGNVYKTTNAGQTWVTSNVGTSVPLLYKMKFSNPNTGVVCGSNGLIRCTTNGGLNWIGTNPPTNFSLFSIVIEGNTIYVSGYVFPQSIYRTTNMGATWDSLSYAGASSITAFLAYSFDKNGNNMMCVGSQGEMIKSTNNGLSWSTLVYRRSTANFNGDLYAGSGNGTVIVTGANLGQTDAIISSTDGGNIWFPAGFTINNFVNGISMISPTTGFIVGRNGIFYKTTNSGLNWDQSLSGNPTLTPYWCLGVSFINANTGWIAGGLPAPAGTTKIWKTTNGGVSWNEQVSAYSGPIGSRIRMLNANLGYLTHGAGLQKTTNGGINWNLITQPSNSAGSYISLSVPDSLNLFTGANNSQVYGSSNGGATWDSLNFPVKAGTIFSTDWYNSQIGCAGAVIGIVGRTINRGQSWQIWNIGGYTVQGIKMVHPDTIFAACGNATGAMVFKYTAGTVGVINYEATLPSEFSLKQNYPNPFNPSTTIEFDLPKQGVVTLKIFDIQGREVAREINGLVLIAGNYKINFNASNLSSGVYFYSLVVDGQNIAARRMVLVK